MILPPISRSPLWLSLAVLPISLQRFAQYNGGERPPVLVFASYPWAPAVLKNQSEPRADHRFRQPVLSWLTIFLLLLLLVCLSLVKSNLIHRSVSCQGCEPCRPGWHPEQCETASVSWAVRGPRLESCGYLSVVRDPRQSPVQTLLPSMLFDTISTRSQRKTSPNTEARFWG